VSVDAAAAVCCCAPPADCCFPIAQCQVSISLSEHTEITFDGVVLRSADRTFTLQTTMVRKLVLMDDFTFRLGMSSEGGTASSRYEEYSTYYESPIAGLVCVGYPNEFYCPPVNTPLPCQRSEDLFSGSLPNASVVIRCLPYICFGSGAQSFPLQLNLRIPAGTVTYTPMGLSGSPCEGDVFSTVGGGDFQTIWGQEGCFSLTTFNQAHWNYLGSLALNYNCFQSGYSVPYTQCGSPFLCNYLSAPDQSWCSYPVFEDYSAHTCNLTGCVNPFTCIIFDCNGQVLFQTEFGCDGVLSSSGFAIGSETGSLAVGLVAERTSRSVNITFLP
jgi:hypothetical protein